MQLWRNWGPVVDERTTGTASFKHNHYVRELKCVTERVVSNQSEDVKIVIRDSRIAGVHQRQTNVPSVNEIAVVISVDDTTKRRDIIIEGIIYLLYNVLYCNFLLQNYTNSTQIQLNNNLSDIISKQD